MLIVKKEESMYWWENYFDEIYLKIYSFIDTPEANQKQVEFIEKALGLEKGHKILDLACGQGRHAILLAKRGYNITGLDYSEYLLSVARKRAENEKVKINFMKGDMRELPFENEFDAIYMFFTSFGYFSDKDNFKVLKEVSRSLKKGGKFLIDLSNPIMVVKNFQYESWILTKEGIICLEQNEFDPIKMRTRTLRIVFKGGKEIDRKEHIVRLYTPSELSFLMELVGLKAIKFYGDWRDFSEYNENSRRLIIIAEKK
jgi:ubiquinone/menaquinone biosynthesis C-methylase UbiE